MVDTKEKTDEKVDVKNKKQKEEQKEEELSEEDQQLKNELEMLVERLKEPDASLYKSSLENLSTLIKTSTSSMTSVPKPLKFLRPHYEPLCELYEQWKDGEEKRLLADVLSVLSMTYGEEDKRLTLKYYVVGTKDATSWGHEYVRHLSSEIIQEYNARMETEQDTSDLKQLALEIVPFFMSHNAEADACDLLLEIESLDELVQYVDKNTYERVCLYIISCVNYVTPPDDIVILKTAHKIYRKMEKLPHALNIAIRMNDIELMKEDFDACKDPIEKKQLAYLLARQQINIEEEDEELNEILNNTKLTENFIALARDLDVMEPRTPEDIYKSHLENIRKDYRSGNVDSAKQNLASTFVNAFVNAGFGTDKLMVDKDEGSSWIYKNKDNGMTSAAASLGAIFLWNVELGLTEIDKYLYIEDDNIKAGALLGIGIVCSGIRNESDPAQALLSEYIESDKVQLRIAAILGLGIAYAGSCREDIMELLIPIVSDSKLSMELSSYAALSLGFIFAGTCNGDITSTILQAVMEREDKDLKDTYARFMGVGLALLYLGKQEACDVALETLKVIEHSIGKEFSVLVETCAYAGTGNVLKVQQMLHILNDHLDSEKEDDKFQAYAVIAIAMIAMGEDIGSEMSLRTFNHLMHYGELVIRRAVPLAIGLVCASNPEVNVLDILSKYSHDNDQEVSLNAIFAMGLVGAGTNNARLAQMLRQLAAYYHKDPNNLFMVRIAQGLLHMGKGTLTINPYHSDRTILSPVAISGLFTVLIACTDIKNIILGKSHYILYYLICSMYPRFLITLDENLNNLTVSVRVGQAVDVVGQAGRPKTITGFQTHTTPVLLGYNERAELATEEYLPLTPVLEGFVILKKNPDYVVEDMDITR
jgi:26S proteasome regulatory subunit N1